MNIKLLMFLRTKLQGAEKVWSYTAQESRQSSEVEGIGIDWVSCQSLILHFRLKCSVIFIFHIFISVDMVVDIDSFDKELAAESLRRNENETQKALDDLTNPETNSDIQVIFGHNYLLSNFLNRQQEVL